MSNITVLISTYNGEKYLSEQIKSLLGQKNVELQIFVRDDGSTDGTTGLLNDYKEQGILDWYQGTNLKSARSFLELLMNAPESEYYAFCDQDDVWNEDKLERAVAAIEKKRLSVAKGKPILYCSNYQLVNSELERLPDNQHVTTTSFSEAIVSSCCTGCTVVFTNELRKLLDRNSPKYIVMHDDWAHKVCLAVGGVVIYDNEKTLKYRQHGNNVDGGVHNTQSKIYGILKRIKTKECLRSKQLEQILNLYEDVMCESAIKLTRFFVTNYHCGLIGRVRILVSKQYGTPYFRLNRGFFVAVLLGYF